MTNLSTSESISRTAYRNAAVLVLIGTAATSGLLASRSLDGRGIQSLMLAGLIAFLIGSRPADEFRRRSSLGLGAAAALAIGAAIFDLSGAYLDPLILLALGYALVQSPERDQLSMVIAASATGLSLLLLIRAIDLGSSAEPVTQVLAAEMAVVAGAIALDYAQSLDAEPAPAALCFAGAAIGLGVTSTGGRPVWMTSALILTGAAIALGARDRHSVRSTPAAVSPITRESAIWGLMSLVIGSIGLTMAAIGDVPLGWPIVGAGTVGVVGILSLSGRWWEQHTDQIGRLESAAAESRSDALTGLHNRRGIDQRMNEEIARAKRYGHPLSILMIDLDDFKSINDRHGHMTGDETLRDVGGSIARSIRSIDIAGRYGGEEFLVILPETTMASAATVAERIRAGVEHLGRTTASVGLADLIGDDMTAAELFERADAALYDAKRLGKNRVVLSG